MTITTIIRMIRVTQTVLPVHGPLASATCSCRLQYSLSSQDDDDDDDDSGGGGGGADDDDCRILS